MKQNKCYIFLGIGGIGMSALALYLHRLGHLVLGYDKTSSEQTRRLRNEGIYVLLQDSVSEMQQQIPERQKESVTVVYTPAVPKTLALWKWCARLFPMKKRAEMLGEISRTLPTLAVAGTHGKTSTSSILVHMLKEANIPMLAFVGGVMENYSTNLILDKDPKWMVVEADEYDRSFLHLTPQGLVITSTDADHLDIYGNAESVLSSFKEFIANAPESAFILAEEQTAVHTPMRYGVSSSSQVLLRDRRLGQGVQQISVCIDGESATWDLPLLGRYNALNTIAASALARFVGVSMLDIGKALRSYKGVRRRFQQFSWKKGVLIDDYAHHPTEVSAVLRSIHEIYPKREITVVFQPHLYSRTRDFLEEFAESLSFAWISEVLLLPIYAAREEPIEGVSSETISRKITTTSSIVHYDEVKQRFSSDFDGVAVFLGAGNIGELVRYLLDN